MFLRVVFDPTLRNFIRNNVKKISASRMAVMASTVKLVNRHYSYRR